MHWRWRIESHPLYPLSLQDATSYGAREPTAASSEAAARSETTPSPEAARAETPPGPETIENVETTSNTAVASNAAAEVTRGPKHDISRSLYYGVPLATSSAIRVSKLRETFGRLETMAAEHTHFYRLLMINLASFENGMRYGVPAEGQTMQFRLPDEVVADAATTCGLEEDDPAPLPPLASGRRKRAQDSSNNAQMKHKRPRMQKTPVKAKCASSLPTTAQ